MNIDVLIHMYVKTDHQIYKFLINLQILHFSKFNHSSQVFDLSLYIFITHFSHKFTHINSAVLMSMLSDLSEAYDMSDDLIIHGDLLLIFYKPWCLPL